MDEDNELWINARQKVPSDQICGRSYLPDKQDSPPLLGRAPIFFFAIPGTKSGTFAGFTKKNTTEGNDKCRTTELSKCGLQYQEAKKKIINNEKGSPRGNAAKHRASHCRKEAP